MTFELARTDDMSTRKDFYLSLGEDPDMQKADYVYTSNSVPRYCRPISRVADSKVIL